MDTKIGEILVAYRGEEPIELKVVAVNDEMNAIGLFEHEGVANHPGDKGMECIAERIFDKINL